MSYSKKNIFFLIFVLFLLFPVGKVSAATPVDATSCHANSGACYKKYNSAGFTFGMSCADQTGNDGSLQNGMCFSEAQVPVNVNANEVVQICCVTITTPVPACTGLCVPSGDACPYNYPTSSSASCNTPVSKCCVGAATPPATPATPPATPATPPATPATPPVASCPAGGCNGGQCTTLGGTCSGAACTNGSFGSCDGGGECCKPAGGAPGSSTTVTFDNYLSFGTVEGVLGSLLSTLQAIIVVLALVFIVIGAVMYILSAGNDGMMKTAKNAITASMIGLALGIAAPSFLKQIGDILGWTPTIDCTGKIDAELATCQAAQATLSQGKTLSAIALSTLQFLLSVVGVLGIIMLVIGGLTYITAAGNEGRSETGKKIVTYAIIGIAIALASLILVTQIAKLFA